MTARKCFPKADDAVSVTKMEPYLEFKLLDL